MMEKAKPFAVYATNGSTDRESIRKEKSDYNAFFESGRVEIREKREADVKRV